MLLAAVCIYLVVWQLPMMQYTNHAEMNRMYDVHEKAIKAISDKQIDALVHNQAKVMLIQKLVVENQAKVIENQKLMCEIQLKALGNKP